METYRKVILLGYVIMRNLRFKVGTPTINGYEWEVMESGFDIDYVKKKLYKEEYSVKEAIEQLRKFAPDDDYEAHPVYWYGRQSIKLKQNEDKSDLC